jgi:hypothetical protein
MDAGDSHEIEVSPQPGSRVDQCRADVHHGVAKKSSAQHDDLDPRVHSKLHRDVRAVRDQRCFEIGCEMPGDLNGRRAAVQNDHLTRLNPRGAGLAEGDFLTYGDSFADA